MFYARYGRALCANGYSAIPVLPSNKAPGFFDEQESSVPLWKWPQYCERVPTPDEIREWEQRNASVGIACGRVIGIDIDFLTESEAEEVEALVRRITSGRPLVRIGRAPKRMLVYRADGVVDSRNKRYSDERNIEVLSTGRQFVAYGLHKDTGLPYTWIGSEPTGCPAASLPPITQVQCATIMDAVSAFLGIAPEVPHESRARVYRDAPPRFAQAVSHNQPRPEAVVAAIEALPNDVGWEEWVKVGFAIWESVRPNEALGWQLFEAWSAKSNLNNKTIGTAHKWRSIIRDSSGQSNFGAILNMLKSRGITLPHHIRFHDEDAGTVVDISALIARYETLASARPALSQDEGMLRADMAAEAVAAVRAEALAPPPPDTHPSLTPEQIEEIERLNGGGEVDNIVKYDNPSLALDLRAELSLRLTPRETPVFPKACVSHSGLIHDISTWILQGSPSPIPEYGLVAATALVGTMAGRAVRTENGARPNLYFLNVGPTGVGKNHAIKSVQTLLASVNSIEEHVLGDMVFSGSGLRQSFIAAAGAKDADEDGGEKDKKTRRADGNSMSKILITDEVGKLIGAHTGEKASANSQTVLGDLLSMFSMSGQIMAGASKVGEGTLSIPYPHLTLMGATTLQALTPSLNEAMLKEGHINRFLLAEVPEAARLTIESSREFIAGGAVLYPPSDIIAKLDALKYWTSRRHLMTGAGSYWNDYAQPVKLTDTAHEFVSSIRMLQEEVGATARGTGGEISEAPFGRLAEIALRLGLISAVSKAAGAPVTVDGRLTIDISKLHIGVTDVLWGWRIARYSAERFAYMLVHEIAKEGDRDMERVRVALRRAGKLGLMKSELMRKLTMQTARADAAIRSLIDSEEVRSGVPPGLRRERYYMSKMLPDYLRK